MLRSPQPPNGDSRARERPAEPPRAPPATSPRAPHSTSHHDPNGNVNNRRTRLSVDCFCDLQQHYVYRWDELNRLDEARRYERTV
ncbi:MAG: hypothetical protein ACFCGT_17275, partial [Sandaracinaceae bacterium]